MPTDEMLAVRQVNLAIGNLTRFRVSAVSLSGATLRLQFYAPENSGDGFVLQMREVVGFHDSGLAERPLTAGIVWCPISSSGHRIADRAKRSRKGLLELRLDFEDAAGLVTRFNAVAESIRVGRVTGVLSPERASKSRIS